MRPLAIAIIGFGKIAADAHVPAIAGNPRFALAASSSRSGAGPAPAFTDWRELLRGVDGLDAVAITTPPGPRYEIAAACIEAGLHVMLEKPPAASLAEAEHLACLADAKGVTLFATWHAQANPAVVAAAAALAGQTIARMDVVWHEDVAKWHPGQQWVWRAGGFGVFDPGINAFSVATRIFPGALLVRSAALDFPRGADTPVAAEIELASPAATGPLHCSLDWRRTAGEQWSIAVRTADGMILDLTDGGARLTIDGQTQESAPGGEYAHLYARFADLIDERRSDVDLSPLRMVADCLLVGSRREVPAARN